MAEIKIALTFDDGPHTKHTATVLGTLATPPVGAAIKAAFFVQTAYPGAMGSTAGEALVKQAHKDGHVIGIHSGAKGGHICHRRRAEEGKLDADMKSAREKLKTLLGTYPSFVRAPFGCINSQVSEVYKNNSLKHIYWHVDSGDTQHLDVMATLTAALPHAIKKKKYPRLIILFHDVRGDTAANLPGYIQRISSVVSGAGVTPRFCQTQDEVLDVLNAPDAIHTHDVRACPGLFKDVFDAVTRFEDPVLWLYRAGNRVLVGYRYHVPSAAAVARLSGFTRAKGGAPASPEDRRGQWAFVARSPAGSVEAFKDAGPVPLRITPVVAKRLFQRSLGDIKRVLDRPAADGGLGKFDDFPDAAQRALFDIAHDLTPAGMFDEMKEFVAAVRAQNWTLAAAKSKRANADPDRNEMVKDLLQAAAP